MINRDNFDYDEYASLIGYEKSPDQEFNDEQKKVIYDGAIKDYYGRLVRSGKGKDKEDVAIKTVLDTFEDSRSSLGIPDEVSQSEPFSYESFAAYLGNNVSEELKDTKLDTWLDAYTESIYDDKYLSLTKPFLKDVNKSTFKKLFKEKSSEFDFDGTVNDALKVANDQILIQEQIEAGIEQPIEQETTFGSVAKNLAASFWNNISGVPSGILRFVDSTVGEGIRKTVGVVNVTDNGVEFLSGDEYSELLKRGYGEELRSLSHHTSNALDETLTVDINPQTTGDRVAAAFGQIGSIALGGLASNSSKLIKKAFKDGDNAAKAVMATMGVAQGSTGGYYDYINSVKENGGTIDPAVERSAIWLNGLLGASESLPVLNAFKRLNPSGKTPYAYVWSTLDKATNGRVSKVLSNTKFNNRVTKLIGNGVVGGIEEGGVELLQGMASDFIASDILKYDPERQVFFSDQTKEGAEAAAYATGIFNTMLTLLSPKLKSKLHNNMIGVDETKTEGDVLPDINKPVVETSSQDDVKKSTLKTKKGTITVTGEDSENILNDLVERHNDENSNVYLQDNMEITKNPDNTFTVKNGTEESTGANLYELLNINRGFNEPGDINQTTPLKEPDFTTEVTLEAGLGKSGILKGQFMNSLRDHGFTDLHKSPEYKANPSDKVNTTQITGYRDGLLYDFFIPNGKTPNIDIRISDLDGNIVKPRRTQPNFNYKLLDGSDYTHDRSSFSFNIPSKVSDINRGVSRKNWNELTDYMNDNASQYNVNLSEDQQFSISNDGLTLNILENDLPVNKLSIDITNDGKVKLLDEGVESNKIQSLINSGIESGSVRLIDDGSDITLTKVLKSFGIAGNKVNMERTDDGVLLEKSYKVSSDNLDLTVRLDDDRNVVILNNETNESKTYDDFIDFKDEFNIPDDIDLDSNSLVDQANLQRSPITEYERILKRSEPRVESSANVIRQIFDTIDVSKYEPLPDGRVRLRHDNGPSVILNEVIDDVDRLKDITEQISIKNLVNSDERQFTLTTNWNKSEVVDLINLYPNHIAQLFDLSDSGGYRSSLREAHGYFSPSGDGSGPKFYVDTRNPSARSFESVVNTISQQASKLSYESFGNKKLNDLYDRVFNVVKSNASIPLKDALTARGLDINKPTPYIRELVINRYFSQNVTNMFDFNPLLIDLPNGIDAKVMIALKRDIDQTMKSIISDMTKDFKGDVKLAEQFIKDSLVRDDLISLGQTVIMSYPPPINNNYRPSIRIDLTPEISSKTTLYNQVEANSIKKTFNELRSKQGLSRKVFKFYLENIRAIYDTPIGANTTILINGAYEPKHQIFKDQLVTIKTLRERMNALMKDNGIVEVKSGDTLFDALIKHNIDNETHLEVAKLLDSFPQIARKIQYENSALLRQSLRNVYRSLKGFTELDGHSDAKSNLKSARSVIEGLIKRYDVEWSHRAYQAYSSDDIPNQQLIQKDIQNYGLGKGKIEENAMIAESELRQLEADLKSGKIEANDEFYRSKVKYKSDIKLAERKLNLITWGEDLYNAQKGDSIEGIVNDELKRIMNHAQSSGDSYSSKATDLISASMARKLNDNDGTDRKLMLFLDPITDPTLVAIQNLEQQNQLISSIDFGVKLATKLVSIGAARPIGSKADVDLYAKGDTSIGKDNTASLLSFIEVEPDYAKFLRDDISMNHALNLNMAGKVVSYIKRNITVLDSGTLVRNYLGNASILLADGAGFYFNRYSNNKVDSDLLKNSKFRLDELSKADQTDPNVIREINSLKETIANEELNQREGFVETSVDLLKDRMLFTLKPTDSLEKSIVDEMRENQLISTSSGSLEVSIINDGALEKAWSGISKILKTSGLLNNTSEQKTNVNVNKFLNEWQKIYGKGDDVVKIPIYLMNRELGIAKAQTMVRRDDYPNTKDGEITYRKAILKIAVPYAASRTNRVTTTWGVTSSVFRKRYHSNAGGGIVISDFVMHPLQMSKVLIENHKIQSEDKLELRSLENNLDDPRVKEYYDVLKKRYYARLSGLLITDLALGSLAVSGVSLSGYALVGLTGLLANTLSSFSDEEGLPLEEQTVLNGSQMEGMQMLLNTQSYDGSYLLSPFPYGKEGYMINVYNSQNYSALNALAPIRPATDDPTASQYISRMAGVFLNTNNSSILVDTYYRLAKERDPFTGQNKLPKERITDVLTRYAIPGFAKDAWTIGSSFVKGDNKAGREEFIKSTTGVAYKGVDVRELVSSNGYDIQRDINASTSADKGYLMRQLTEGSKLKEGEIRSLIIDNIKANQKFKAKADYAVKGARLVGFSDKEIKSLLFKTWRGKSTNLSEDNANGVVDGLDIWSRSTIVSLSNKLENESKLKSPDDPYKAQQFKNLKDNLKLAIEIYKRELKRRGE